MNVGSQFESLVGFRVANTEDLVNRVNSIDSRLEVKDIVYDNNAVFGNDNTIVIDFKVCDTLDQDNAMITLYYIKDNSNRLYITEVCFDFI